MTMIAGEANPSAGRVSRQDISPQLNREEQLIRDAQTGNMRAFNELVQTYQALAFRVAYRILGDQEMAADATQETFLSAYRNINRLRGGSFKAWLTRIVTNAGYDQLRRRQRQHSVSLDALFDDPDRVGPRLAQANEELPPEQAERHELNQVIQKNIARLAFDQRVALVLIDVEGHSYEQAAEITGANVGTVKSRLSRGRANLRSLLLAEEGLLPAKYRWQRAGLN